MSQEQAFLNPDQQQKLFDVLKGQGLLSHDFGASPDTQDSAAQAGVGNVDFNTLQSLIKHAANPDSVPMQEGDKMHPMDAIQQIAQTLAPQQPNQGASTNLVGVQPRTPGHGLGSWISKLITGKPLMHDFGNPVMGTTAAPDVGNLPASMRPQPIGTDANGKPIYDYAAMQKLQGYEGALATATAKGQASHPLYSPDMALAIASGDKDKAIHQWQSENPGKSLPGDILTKLAAAQGANSRQQIAGALSTRSITQQIKAAYDIGGGPALSKMASNSNVTLGLVGKIQPLVMQIEQQGGKATAIQANELGRNMAAISSVSGSGIISDHAMDAFIPNSIVKKYGSSMEWLTNTQQPVDFSGFLPQFKGLIGKEIAANQAISAGAAQFGADIAKGYSPEMAHLIALSRNNNPVVGTNAGQETPENTTRSLSTNNITPPNRNLIRVFNIQTGQTGMMPAGNFDQSKYRKL